MFTDEGFMALSIAAKAVWPGIWTEADDHGVFEWKPITLKARLLPADNVDMAELMGETLKHGLTMQFTVDGRTYGVVKGFLKWQRPREPSYRFPFPKAAELFARNSPIPTAGLPQECHEPAPIGPQREEEGGKREEVPLEPSGSNGADAPDPVKLLFDDGVKLLTENGCKESNARSLVGKWRGQYGDEPTQAAIKAARAASCTEPIAWITHRLAAAGKPHENWNDRRIRETREALRTA